VKWTRAVNLYEVNELLSMPRASQSVACVDASREKNSASELSKTTFDETAARESSGLAMKMRGICVAIGDCEARLQVRRGGPAMTDAFVVVHGSNAGHRHARRSTV